MKLKMNKITWPTSEKVMNNLGVVLLGIITIMIFLYVADNVFTFILDKLY